VEIRVPATSRITLDIVGDQINIGIKMTLDTTEGHSVARECEQSGKISSLELTTMMDSTAPDCDTYWEHAAWLPPWYILDRWCQRDDRCRQAKYEALLTACEQGDVKYGRRDGKDFEDPVRDLADRRILIIERASFDVWAAGIDGESPLSQPPRPAKPLPPRPAWADRYQRPPVAAQSPVEIATAAGSAPVQDNSDAETPPSKSNTQIFPQIPTGDVATAEIIAAFPVKQDEAANTEWWKNRMSEAKDNGLKEARTYAGRLNDPSRWRPDGIAHWLVIKGHLKAKVVKHIITRSFPDWSDAVDYFIAD
jgi:hypothetical protein